MARYQQSLNDFLRSIKVKCLYQLSSEMDVINLLNKRKVQC